MLATVSPAALAYRTAAPAPRSKAAIALGRTLFRANCGVCHTLSAAGTHGRLGPNLAYEGLDYPTVAWMIVNGDSVMPSFQVRLKTVQIDDVAAFVMAAIS